MNVPCIKTENERASNGITNENDSLESATCTGKDDLSFQEIPLERKRTVYIGDPCNSNTLTDHEKDVIATTLMKKNKKIKALQRTNRQLRKKVEDLNELLYELHKKNMNELHKRNMD